MKRNGGFAVTKKKVLPSKSAAKKAAAKKAAAKKAAARIMATPTAAVAAAQRTVPRYHFLPGSPGTWFMDEYNSATHSYDPAGRTCTDAEMLSLARQMVPA